MFRTRSHSRVALSQSPNAANAPVLDYLTPQTKQIGQRLRWWNTSFGSLLVELIALLALWLAMVIVWLMLG